MNKKNYSSKKIKLFDSHAHLLDGRLKGDEQIMDEVDRAVTVFEPGEGIREYEKLLANPRLYGACGVHPHYADGYSEKENELVEGLGFDKTVALGETGLDFHYENSPREIQKEAFASQLKLADSLSLPVIVHSRKAFRETMRILEGFNGDVLFHCFSEGPREMEEVMERGYYVSTGGIITFPSAESVREAFKVAVNERVLIETDSPYLAPVPKRGKVNRPLWVRYVAGRLAEIKGISLPEMSVMTYNNASVFFGIE